MNQKMISDFESKKFFVFYLRHFSIERSWSYTSKNDKLVNKPLWELRIRFSYAWNHKGFHFLYFWHSFEPVEPFFAAFGTKG